MGVPDVISYLDDFQGPNEYAFLSNFYQGQPIHFGPYVHLTGEHLFQALKARTKHDYANVVRQSTPSEAKAWGKRLLRLRPDWERVKYDAMRLTLALKFSLKRDEGPWLLDTGDALIVEGTTWGDQVWGVDLRVGQKEYDNPEPGDGWFLSPGRNWLGALLMARRAELRAELLGVPPFQYETTWKFVRYEPVKVNT